MVLKRKRYSAQTKTSYIVCLTKAYKAKYPLYINENIVIDWTKKYLIPCDILPLSKV